MAFSKHYLHRKHKGVSSVFIMRLLQCVTSDSEVYHQAFRFSKYYKAFLEELEFLQCDFEECKVNCGFDTGGTEASWERALHRLFLPWSSRSADVLRVLREKGA